MPRKKRPRHYRVSTMYNFILSRQLDGTLDKGPSHGIFPQTGMRVCAGWGIVADHRFPKPIGPWSPHNSKEVNSKELDRIAGYKRFFSYFRVRDLDDAKKSIDRTRSVGIAVPTTKRW